MSKWWDEAELVLLGTGDIALAEQFAVYCKSVDDGCIAMLGLDPDVFNQAMFEIEHSAVIEETP